PFVVQRAQPDRRADASGREETSRRPGCVTRPAEIGGDVPGDAPVGVRILPWVVLVGTAPLHEHGERNVAHGRHLLGIASAGTCTSAGSLFAKYAWATVAGAPGSPMYRANIWPSYAADANGRTASASPIVKSCATFPSSARASSSCGTRPVHSTTASTSWM